MREPAGSRGGSPWGSGTRTGGTSDGRGIRARGRGEVTPQLRLGTRLVSAAARPGVVAAKPGPRWLAKACRSRAAAFCSGTGARNNAS